MDIKYIDKQLRKASRSNVQPEHLYKAILNSFPNENPILAHRRINGNEIIWSIPNKPNEKWYKLSDVSDLEADAVYSIIASYKKKIQDELHLSDDDIKGIFTTPDGTSCIYFTVDGAPIQVCIIGWDFTSENPKKTKTIVVNDSDPKRQKVSIEFISSEEPIPNQTFTIKLPSGFAKKLQTGDNGFISIGDIIVSTQIELEISDNHQVFSFEVIKDQELYSFDLTPKIETLKPLLSVVDDQNEPLVHTPLSINLPTGEEIPVETDEQGQYQLPECQIGENFTVRDCIYGNKSIFTIEKGMSNYIFKITIPTEKKEFEKVVPQILVIDETDQPIPNHPLDITLPSHETIHATTDSNGVTILPECNVEEKFSVKDCKYGATAHFTVENDKDKYILRIAIPIIQEDVKPLLLVVNEDDIPIANIPLDITLPSEETIHVATDENGKYELPQCKVGDNFKVTDSKYDTEGIFKVKQDTIEYILKIHIPNEPIDIEPYLQVLDQNDEPVINYPLTVDMPSGESIHIFTNEEGRYQFPIMHVGECFQITDGFTERRVSYEVKQDQEEYIYKLDYEPSSQESDITVKVIDEHEHPVSNGRILLKQGDHSLLIDLLEDGEFYLSDGTFEKNKLISVKLIDRDKRTYTSSEFKLIDKEREYIIQLDTKNYPIWKQILAYTMALLFALCCIACYPYLWGILNSIILKTY